MAPAAEVVSVAEAVEAIKAAAQAVSPLKRSGRLGRDQLVVVALAGGPASGKDWLASQARQHNRTCRPVDS